MNPDLLLPIIASAAWLILAGSALASRRLGWGQMARMALAWVSIFLGLYLIVEWFLITRNAAGTLL